MSTQLNGLSAVTLAGLAPPKNIVSSTNTNPIIVTATAHGLTTGDEVSINGHAVNTSANGTNVATVLTVNTYSIPVAGVGVGGATGTSQSMALGPTFAIPSDGDAIAAASVNVAFEALADRTAFLALATGASKVVAQGSNSATDNTFAQYDSWTITSLSTWTDLTGGTTWEPLNPTDVQAGDVVDVRAALNVRQIATGGGANISQIALWYEIQPPGGSAAFTQVIGSSRITVAVASQTQYASMAPSGIIVCGTSGKLIVKAMAFTASTLANLFELSLHGDFSVTAVQYRFTGMNQ